MEPLPETAEVDRQYGPFIFRGEDLLEQLVALGEKIETVAPDCVGLSLCVESEQGVIFTLVSHRSRGVATSLSYTLRPEAGEVGNVHLYGATPDSFRDREAELIELLGASAASARIDTDLGFETRDAARLAPSLVRESTHLSLATALVSRVRTLPLHDADLRIRDVADKSGVSVSALAAAIIAVLSDV